MTGSSLQEPPEILSGMPSELKSGIEPFFFHQKQYKCISIYFERTSMWYLQYHGILNILFVKKDLCCETKTCIVNMRYTQVFLNSNSLLYILLSVDKYLKLYVISQTHAHKQIRSSMFLYWIWNEQLKLSNTTVFFIGSGIKRLF